MTFEEILSLPQYSLPQAQKEILLLNQLNALALHHRDQCGAYERILQTVYPKFRQAERLADVPFLPVGLFKTHRLMSIPEARIFKILTSSGTTGQQPSQIFLDPETARRQSAALVRIMTTVLGPRRLPMLIVDTASVLQDRAKFSARVAGILGMMNIGRAHTFVLDDGMELSLLALRAFLERFNAGPIVLFGFTYMVWLYFLKAVRGLDLDLSNAILIHTGGWKKLRDEAVTNEEFKRAFQDQTGITQVYNFYGMAEQVGSVFVEGRDGFLHAPNFADVIVRNPVTWEEAPVGAPGVIEVLSILPLSYPGHAILTEDLGVVHGVDDSSCDWRGKYFSVIGRVPRSELRGCSDIHAYQ